MSESMAGVRIRGNCADDPRCTCAKCVLARAAWAQRPSLLAIARARTLSEADAHDVVSEAIARALEAEVAVEVDRVGAWLTAVILNLCVDLGRDRARHHKRVRFTLQHHASPPSFDSLVDDRLTAAAVVPLLAKLSREQHRALTLRSEGLAVSQIAQRLQVSEKAVESLLSRARTAARAVLRPALAGLAAVMAVAKRGLPTATAMSSAALVLALLVPTLGQPGTPTRFRNTRGLPATSSVLSRVVLAVDVQPSTPLRPAHHERARIASALGTGTGREYVRQPSSTSLGPVKVNDAGAGKRRPDETFVQSVERCVTQGIEVSARYVGCRDAQSPR